VSHCRRARIKELETLKLDALAKPIEKHKGGAQMFAAIKALKEANDSKAPLIVHDKNGNTIYNEPEAASLIAEHFKGQFNSPNSKPLQMFEGDPRSLNRQITGAEVEDAHKGLKAGKAVGPDGFPVEGLKAGGPAAAAFVAEVLNQSYSLHKSVGIGEGLLRALQKPGKLAGPLANLRSIVLLTLLRKVLSLVVLRRIRATVEGYLAASHAGFRKGRSTADIVWAHRWLAAKAIRYKATIYILGLDMSRAFDTIDRAKLMRILKEEVQLDNDELRMCQSLLAETSLRVKLGEALSDPFASTIGTPQGDGLSPILFAIYFESVLRQVREAAGPRPATDHGLPLEAIYADDTDFISMRTRINGNGPH